MIALDEDAVIACVDLVGRTGATDFEIGYVNDEPPHAWYAHAQFRGARITAEDHSGPVEAADALARRLLAGARCRCGRLVALTDAGAVAVDGHLVDGTAWTAADAQKAGQCRWTRQGRRWEMGCAHSHVGNRAERRAEKRDARRKGGRR